MSITWYMNLSVNTGAYGMHIDRRGNFVVLLEGSHTWCWINTSVVSL